MVANYKVQVSNIRRKHILLARDSLAGTPAAANNWLKVISVLLDYAVDLEYVEHNVVREKIGRLPPLHAGGFRQWREDEIAAYLAHHALGSVAHQVHCSGALDGRGARRPCRPRLAEHRRRRHPLPAAEDHPPRTAGDDHAADHAAARRGAGDGVELAAHVSRDATGTSAPTRA